MFIYKYLKERVIFPLSVPLCKNPQLGVGQGLSPSLFLGRQEPNFFFHNLCPQGALAGNSDQQRSWDWDPDTSYKYPSQWLNHRAKPLPHVYFYSFLFVCFNYVCVFLLMWRLCHLGLGVRCWDFTLLVDGSWFIR